MKHIKRHEGIVIKKLSPLAGVIQDKRTKEEFFFFASDCGLEVVPRIGTEVTFKRDGIDMAAQVRIQLDESQAA